MAVQNSNFNTLITAIDTKAQSLAASTTDPKDLVYLAKSLESLNVTATVSEIIAAGDTKVTAVNTAGSTQVGVVQAEGATQVAAVAAAGGSYATSSTLDAMRSIVLVTVAGGKLVMDGTSQQALSLTPSVKYRFDQSDASNATHPLQFSITDDGTHGGGAALTAGVTVVGTAGSAGAYVEYVVEQDSVATYYYCGSHAAMGGTAYTTTVAGGGAGAYTGAFALHTLADDLSAAGASLRVANLNAYARSVRIRSLDTSTKAIFGINHQSQNTAGNIGRHTFTTLSANQTTGIITREAVQTFNANSTSVSDYSTFSQTSDEWTGRYTYRGNVPTAGAAHTESYHKILITADNAGTSEHTNSSTYTASSNGNSVGSYVAPSERRTGGAVKHYIASYNASSQAVILEYNYSYNATGFTMANQETARLSKSANYITYQADIFNQWDVTNEPYYTAFFSFDEGLFGALRSNGTFAQVSTNLNLYPKTNGHAAFILSNGCMMLISSRGDCAHISTSGTLTAIASAQANPFANIMAINNSKFCVNVGTDEWLQFLPNSKVVKFKINPTTGATTLSGSKTISSIEYAAYDSYFHHKRGLYSSFSANSVHSGTGLFTFGNENSNGPGYGKSKLMFVGATQAAAAGIGIFAATYDIAPILAELTYP